MGMAREAFYRYTDKFSDSEERIDHKIQHSVRVSARAREVARAIKLTSDDVELATLIGLIHDLGRFEQFTRHNTYVDRKSEDHARLGNELLFSRRLIREFIVTDSYDRIIKLAVGHHNAYSLPERLDERELLHCKIIRDADKLDNLYIKPFEPFFALFGKEDISGGVITPSVLEDFLALRMIRHIDVRTSIDNWIKYIAFYFGLYFDESLKIACDGDFAGKMLSRVEGGPLIRTLRKCDWLWIVIAGTDYILNLYKISCLMLIIRQLIFDL